MKTALLVVDVQVSLVADETPNPEAILGAVEALVDKARKAGAPIVWVTDSRVEPDAALHPALRPGVGERHVVKSQRSAFTETGLDTELKALGIDQVVICGMQSDACIDGTTRAAAALGYEVVLAADAHTTHAFAGRDWQAVVAAQNKALGALARVAARPLAAIEFFA